MSSAAQFLWIGGRLSAMERLALRSFLDHGYAVHLYTYGEVEGVPEDVTRLPGADILPESRIFTVAKGWGAGSYANFADLFRYHLLRLKGGWWFDLDFVSIRRLPDPDGLWIASSWEGAAGELANCCALHAPPGHPLFERLCVEAEAELARASETGFGQIGPYLLQRLVRDLDLGRHVAPWWEFSPFPQGQINRIAYPPRTGDFALATLRGVKQRLRSWHDHDFRHGRLRPDTRALHLHNELWRDAGRDKGAAYHPACLFERLKRRHEV